LPVFGVDQKGIYGCLFSRLTVGDLGSGVIKQRVVKPSNVKLTGFRIIIAYFRGKYAFFIHGL